MNDWTRREFLAASALAAASRDASPAYAAGLDGPAQASAEAGAGRRSAE